MLKICIRDVHCPATGTARGIIRVLQTQFSSILYPSPFLSSQAINSSVRAIISNANDLSSLSLSVISSFSPGCNSNLLPSLMSVRF